MKIQIFHVARIDRELTIDGLLFIGEDQYNDESEFDYVEIKSISSNKYCYNVERLYAMAPKFMEWIEEEFGIKALSEQELLYDYNDYIDYDIDDDYDN